MMPEETPAPAAEEAVPAPKPSARKARTVEAKRVRIVRIETGSIDAPAAVYKGDAPKKGDTLAFHLGGGAYEGTVADVTEADGEVLVEFTMGANGQHLRPV